MALLASIVGAANLRKLAAHKVTDEALCIKYLVLEGREYTIGEQTSYLWNVRRFATKRYRYVGLTEACAKAVRDAKIVQYTKTKKLYAPAPSGHVDSYVAQACQADIKAIHVEGRVWCVEIQVNEQDQVYNYTVNNTPPHPRDFFVNTNSGISDDPRLYDE